MTQNDCCVINVDFESNVFRAAGIATGRWTALLGTVLGFHWGKLRPALMFATAKKKRGEPSKQRNHRQSTKMKPSAFNS